MPQWGSGSVPGLSLERRDDLYREYVQRFLCLHIEPLPSTVLLVCIHSLQLNKMHTPERS